MLKLMTNLCLLTVSAVLPLYERNLARRVAQAYSLQSARPSDTHAPASWILIGQPARASLVLHLSTALQKCHFW